MSATAAILAAGSAQAFNQPPANLSATTFLDGGAPPGFYYLNYTIMVQGQEAKNNDGDEIASLGKVNVFAQLHQFYYISKLKFLGANVALDVAVPVVAPTAKGGILTANTAGMGDLLVGPALHWDNVQLFGKTTFHRVESDVTFPTGKYDKNFSVNPGSNLTTVDSYYSFVMFLSQKLETSWRLWYAFHNTNDDHALGEVKPGQRFHVNGAVSLAVTPKWRVGVAGYYLQQLTEDEINSVEQVDSKERTMALGPGLVYMGNGLTAMLSHPIEFGVRNRFQGSRTTLQLIHRF